MGDRTGLHAQLDHFQDGIDRLDVLVLDGDAAANGQHVKILGGDIGRDRQRHRLPSEARGFQLFIGGAQIVPRQAPEIQFIAGIEAQTELFAVEKLRTRLTAAATAHAIGLAANLRKQRRPLDDRLGLCLHDTRRRHRDVAVAVLRLVDQRSQLRVAETLPPGRLWPDLGIGHDGAGEFLRRHLWRQRLGHLGGATGQQQGNQGSKFLIHIATHVWGWRGRRAGHGRGSSARQSAGLPTPRPRNKRD